MERGSAGAQPCRVPPARGASLRRCGAALPSPSAVVRFVPVLRRPPHVLGDGTCDVWIINSRVCTLVASLLLTFPFPTPFPSLLAAHLRPYIFSERHLTECGCSEIQRIVRKGAKGKLGVWEIRLIVSDPCHMSAELICSSSFLLACSICFQALYLGKHSNSVL